MKKRLIEPCPATNTPALVHLKPECDADERKLEGIMRHKRSMVAGFSRRSQTKQLIFVQLRALYRKLPIQKNYTPDEAAIAMGRPVAEVRESIEMQLLDVMWRPEWAELGVEPLIARHSLVERMLVLGIRPRPLTHGETDLAMTPPKATDAGTDARTEAV